MSVAGGSARAQVAVEFVFMIMLVLIFLVVILVIVHAHIQRSQSEKRVAAMKELAVMVQEELLIAGGVNDGYQRLITLPSTIRGEEYSVSNTPSLLTITLANGQSYGIPIPRVNGTIMKGENLILKVNGELRVEQP